MAQKKQPSGNVISNAIRAERQSGVTNDRSNLKDTLLKSPRWKKGALQRIEAAGSGDPNDQTPAVLHMLKQSLLELIERHWQELAMNARARVHNRPTRAGENHDPAMRKAQMQQQSNSMREALVLHAEEAEGTRRRPRKRAATQTGRDEEMDRLRRTIMKLEAEIDSLAAEHRDELDAQRIELSELQKAYDQFEQQTDTILNELCQQNKLLRAECNRQNKRSMLRDSALHRVVSI